MKQYLWLIFSNEPFFTECSYFNSKIRSIGSEFIPYNVTYLLLYDTFSHRHKYSWTRILNFHVAIKPLHEVICHLGNCNWQFQLNSRMIKNQNKQYILLTRGEFLSASSFNWSYDFFIIKYNIYWNQIVIKYNDKTFSSTVVHWWYCLNVWSCCKILHS